MPHKKIQSNFQELMKLFFILSPPVTFMIYLHVQHTINTLELIIFFMVTALPVIMTVQHFQRKLALLDRETTLQIHDHRAAKKNQILLMNIMEKLSDPILILDSADRILMANKSAHSLLGQQILKQNISVFIRNSILDDAMKHAHETGELVSCEFKLGKPNAKHYLTRIHLFDLADSQITDSSQYIFLALYDISALKQTDKMRADFVANASHELRTPLASILGFIETLQGPARNDDQAHDRFLSIMHDESSRMSRLIEDLLSLSRIERDQHIPPSDRINLSHLIKSVIDVLEPQAESKHMAIHFTSDNMNKITADHDQVTQVFQNLIENAIKYGDENTDIEVTFEASMLPEHIAAKDVTVTITNEGPGIAPEHLPRLMERFYRVDSARSRSLGGTGLGLAIVKHIIKRHKGRIFFKSELNSTTKVTLSLPIGTSPPPVS